MNRNLIVPGLILLLGISTIFFSACSTAEIKKSTNKTVKAELKQVNGKYLLLKDGEPFFIKGAGLEFGNMASLKEHGGNTLRTWRIDNGKQSGREVLDEAQKHGLMVCMGIEVGRERHGFDYNDSLAVRAQFEQIKRDVEALKDHPALLLWGIGNELNLRYTNVKVWSAVNEIAKMIHEIDPNHPVTTMLAGAAPDVLMHIKEYAPELDFLSFQLYGDIVNLPDYLRDGDYNGAYIVSEWGATGHWEVPATSWGRPIEHNSHDKAQDYLMRYQKVIEADPTHCLGSFVFLWGQKQERTPTWYGIFMPNGEETEAVDMMHYVWNAKWPDNRVPQLKSFTLDGKTAYESVTLKSGKEFNSLVQVVDLENDTLAYHWQIMREVPVHAQSDGGDFEETPEVVWQSEGTQLSEISFTAPATGEYRLFVYASDGHGNAATANISFLVVE